MEYRILALNLERRADRWEHSYKMHRANGVPHQWIERWNARDGLVWKRDDWVNDEPYPELKEAAFAATGNTPFLDQNPKYLCDYCWQWSFYEAFQDISNRDTDKLYIFMHDDFSLNIDHDSLLHCVNWLTDNDPAFMAMPLNYKKGIELRAQRIDWHPHTIKKNMFQHTILKNLRFTDQDVYGDTATLVSPAGAKLITKLADKHGHHPPHVMKQLSATVKGIYHPYPDWAYLDYDAMRLGPDDRESF